MYPPFVFSIPEDGHIWPKHVGGHCLYKLISIYLCAFVGMTIIDIQLMHGLWSI